jgi:riboflavin kinase/FMN adenylyltransferase
MRILENGLESLQAPPTAAIVTIGNFDGVHRGHSRIFSMVVQEAKATGGTSVLVTFKPHPTKVLTPGHAPPMISTREQRYGMFEEAGIELAVVLTFTREFSYTTADAFVRDLLVPRLAPRKIIIGLPFRFGHNREGDVDRLAAIGRDLGFHAEGVGEVDIDGQTISSTRIRKSILLGKIADGNRMLGRPFEVVGVVVPGDARGKDLSFPTANLEVENELLPADGVYVTHLLVGDRTLGSVTNIGVRPTFEGTNRVVESHALDFDEDLYGRTVCIRFLARLRGEMRFPSPEALVAQIRVDVGQARELLARFPG